MITNKRRNLLKIEPQDSCWRAKHDICHRVQFWFSQGDHGPAHWSRLFSQCQGCLKSPTLSNDAFDTVNCYFCEDSFFSWNLRHRDEPFQTILVLTILPPPRSIGCLNDQTLPKAQRTRELSSADQSNFFRSYHKFSNKSWLDFIFIISTKQQLQNISQISAFRLILNFKILTK